LLDLLQLLIVLFWNFRLLPSIII